MDIDLGKGQPDGSDTAKEIMKIKDIPIVFLSSHTTPDIVEKAEKITSYGYIVKNSGETVINASIKMAFRLYEAHKKIEQEEENYRITLESVGDAILSTDIDGIISKTNNVARELIGTDDLIGKNIDDVFHIVNAHTRKRVENPIEKVLQTGKVVGLANHTVLISKDGKEYQIADSAAPIKNDSNEMLGVVLVFRDVTKKYAQEEKIMKSEKKYRMLFENMNISFAFHEMIYENNLPVDYRFLEVNPNFERDTGVSSETLVGNTAKELFPDTEQYWIDLFSEVVKTGESIRCQKYSKELDKWYDTFVFFSWGNSFGAFFIDITDLKQSEKKYKEIVDYSPVGMFQTHSDGHVLFTNPAMYKMVGTESEEEAKKYFNDLNAKLYASNNRREEFIELLNTQGYVEDFEFEAISKTKKHLWFRMNARRGDKDNEGEFIIDGFTTDITDLRDTQEELRKEGIFLQQLTDTSPIGITRVDENGNMVYANRAAEEILGLTKDKITDRVYNDPKWEIASLDGSPFPDEELPFYRVKKEGKTVYDVRHTVKDENGNIRTLSINAAPIYNGNGFEGMVSTLLDISRQTIAENELKQSIEDKDMLMRELNHRVKNNLNMISSLISLKNFELQSTSLYDITAQIEAISIIHEKVQETGDLQYVELREYVQNLLQSIFESFGDGDVEIENNIANVDIKTKDAMALGLIINEVATNAIKYGFNNEEARFIVDLEEEGDYYKLYLTNTGNKFSKDVDIEKVDSLGMQLITALSSQLKGDFELIKEPNTTFVIRFLKE